MMKRVSEVSAMTALEIYQQDIDSQQQGTVQPRQQFFMQLRDALYQELTEQGYSELLEQLYREVRDGNMKKIYVVDYAVLMACHSMIVLGKSMRDASEYVPHLQKRGARVTWAELEQSGGNLMPVTQELIAQLRQLRAVSRQLVEARDSSVTPQAGDAAQREIDRVHFLNKMLEERNKDLLEEKEALQARVDFLEQNVITEQVRYAIEAKRIEAEEELRIQREANQAAAKEAFRTQYAAEQAAEAARREEAERAFAADRAEAAKEYSAVRWSMGNDLRQLSALLEAKINAWDRGLDRAECRLLANCYVGLHDLLTHTVARAVLDARCAGTGEAVLASLAEVERGLGDRVHQLEQAMARLGLTVLRPAAGDAFDGAFHLAAGNGADGAVIEACVRPGVMVQGASGALVKAEVRLK